MSARRHFSHERIICGRATKERVLHLRECAASTFVQYFLKRTLCCEEDGAWFELLLSSQIIFRMLKKANAFFEWLVRKRRFPALVLQNHPKSIRTSARTSISRTTVRSQNVILKVVSSKT
jgi:hypothetical protein